MLASIIVRTYNEEKHLPDLLEKIRKQTMNGEELEIIVVDSGSTDTTLDIAQRFRANIIHIEKDDFSFGRSLNVGCDAAQGDYLVFVSGHCIPQNDHWLLNLLNPLIDNKAAYVYGRQVGNGECRFSERQLFQKYFPETSKIPQEGFFCNNANAAITRAFWQENRFDEALTGLEDMELAKRLVAKGHVIGYVADAPVFHLHDESWHRVRMRYQREAIALRTIMPEVHIRLADFLRFYVSAVLLDCGSALRERELLKRFKEIVLFRCMQYWGSYRGNHEHRKLSARLREQYFYPK
jgi:glycosyltransferase involved in cell wall biosynthesis